MPVELELFEDQIAILRINRPQVRNALDWEAMDKFQEHMETAHTMHDLRALVVTGVKESFIAGGDLKVLHNHTSAADGERLSRLMSNALGRLEALPCPTVAAINGPARGGGAEISLACDMRIMDERADLGFVQVNLGLVPGWGAGQRLLRLAGYSRAFELLATGCVISAEEALTYGIVNRLAPPGEAEKYALDVCREIASQPAQAVRAIKRLLRAGVSLPPATAAAFERAEFPALWESEDHQQAVQKFLARKR